MIWLLLACSHPETDSDTLADDATARITSSEACEACDGACVEEELAYAARYHVVAPVDYVDLPPAGGPHNRCWADWGMHTEPVLDDNFVHNLEHGGVVLLWSCPEGCDADVSAISDFVATHERTVGTPYPDLPTRFAIVAWGARLLTSCFDPTAADGFYAARFDHAPESTGSVPPTGCTDDTDG